MPTAPRPRLRSLLCVAAAVLAVASCGGDDEAPTAYGPTAEREFMELCAPGDSDGTDATDATGTDTTEGDDEPSSGGDCACAYDRIVETIPFEQYVDEYRDALLDGPSSWPDEITDLMTDCVLEAILEDTTGTTGAGG